MIVRVLGVGWWCELSGTERSIKRSGGGREVFNLSFVPLLYLLMPSMYSPLTASTVKPRSFLPLPPLLLLLPLALEAAAAKLSSGLPPPTFVSSALETSGPPRALALSLAMVLATLTRLATLARLQQDWPQKRPKPYSPACRLPQTSHTCERLARSVAAAAAEDDDDDDDTSTPPNESDAAAVWARKPGCLPLPPVMPESLSPLSLSSLSLLVLLLLLLVPLSLLMPPCILPREPPPKPPSPGAAAEAAVTAAEMLAAGAAGQW